VNRPFVRGLDLPLCRALGKTELGDFRMTHSAFMVGYFQFPPSKTPSTRRDPGETMTGEGS
jgi:hypothetical protein